MKRYIRGSVIAGSILLAVVGTTTGRCQLTENERKPVVGDSPSNPGPLATNLSGELDPQAVKTAMRKVADWQLLRIEDAPSQDWTFGTLYLGLLAASDTLTDARYQDTVLNVANHFDWTLGPRESHADDQAIGQSYLWLYRKDHIAEHLAPLQRQLTKLSRFQMTRIGLSGGGVTRSSWLLQCGQVFPEKQARRIT
jgi:unsaturated rhamnogalacturonyl hydrolase